MTEASERRVAALRRLIELGGKRTAGGRWRLGAVVGGSVRLVLVAFCAVGAYHAICCVDSALAVAVRLLCAGLAGLLIVEAVVRLMAFHFRSLYARGLRRRLASLPLAEQAAILRPLMERAVMDQPASDTRKIAASLARSLHRRAGPRSELSPADAPTGRGNEPTPTR